MTTRYFNCLLFPALALATPAFAHVSERAFVGLLPTDVYIAAGVTAVALTAVALLATPDHWITRLFRPPKEAPRKETLRTATSLVGLAFVLFLLFTGVTGSHDPLKNPLPLAFWTLWWIGMPLAQALLGDLWSWINPWTGLHRLVFGNHPPVFSAAKLSYWPAIAGFLAFAYLITADPIPDNPARLAWIIGSYLGLQFVLAALFGRDWLRQGECFTVYFGWLARLSPFDTRARGFIAMPGARLAVSQALPVSGAVLILVILATGSFDGLNETFWWLAAINVNPLEFPGRSAVVLPNVLGVLIFATALPATFAATTWLGLRLVNQTVFFREAFGRLAFSILPIALGYHLAHYLTAAMVNGQYALAAASDPLNTGADLLNLGQFYVTTGFFNTRATAEAIWLTQAGAIVAGHALAILVAHAIAIRIVPSRTAAIISQIPVAIFMVLYTLFGLWLLASPIGA